MERKAKYDSVSIGNSDSYCTYHQRRGHTINSCKALKETILNLVAQGKYKIKENTSDLDHIVNTILVDKEIYATLKRKRPRSNPHPHQNLVTNEHISLTLDPKAYSMIE